MSSPADFKNELQERLSVLRQLIREGEASTQEDLCDALNKKKFDITQSTVSRDLRRIGAIRTTNADGEIIYKMPEDHQPLPPSVMVSLDGFITDIDYNESMIVIHTTAGSASLIARHLDSQKNELGVLGTLAGDDTIFIVPVSVKKISAVIQNIKNEFY